MCRCNPQIKSPFCGQGDCKHPHETINTRLLRAAHGNPEMEALIFEATDYIDFLRGEITECKRLARDARSTLMFSTR